MTGLYELCMLIDGVVKRFPTAIVHIDTPFYERKTKVLCMENPVQEVIVGNIPGALGLQQYRDNDLHVAEQTEDVDQRDILYSPVRRCVWTSEVP